MERPTRDLLRDLAAVQEGPCVSLFVAYEPDQTPARQNDERLRTALDDVEVKLQGRGLSPKGSAQLIAHARAALAQERERSVKGRTLAIFLSPAVLRAVLLPDASEPLTIIADQFHVLPLLPVVLARELPARKADAEQRLLELRASYEAAIPTGRAISGLHLVLPAAMQGNIEHLFVSQGAVQWGKVDPEGTIILHDHPEPGDDDLLSLALLHVFLHDGHGYILPSERMPEGAMIAAELR